MAMTPEGRTVVSGSDDNKVRVWDIVSGQARVCEGHIGPVRGVAVTADGREGVSGATDGAVGFWDLDTGQKVLVNAHGGAVLAVAVTGDGRTAVSGSNDRRVLVWKLVIGLTHVLEGHSDTILALEGHSDTILAVAVTDYGNAAVSGSMDRTVRVWDLHTGEARILDGHGGSGQRRGGDARQPHRRFGVG